MSFLILWCCIFYFHLLQHQFMKWRNIVILKLRPKFHVFHPLKMVLEFSQRMNSFLFAFPLLFWPDVGQEIIGKQFLKNKIKLFFSLVCLFITYIPVDGDHDRYHMEGLMESPAVDDDGDCLSPLLINATSVNIGVYYNKAVNYTLMVTFVSFKYHYPSFNTMLLASFGWIP